MDTNNKRYITIPTINWIPALGVFGPIIQPRSIAESTAFNLVCHGFELHEHAMSGKYAGATVRLTATNFYDENRFAEDTSVTPKIIDITKNFGAAVNGQAQAVDPIGKDAPVPVVAENTAETEAASIPKVATPIPGNMSKAQRKKAAKEAARAAAAAKAVASEETVEETEEVTETPADETTDDTVTE